MACPHPVANAALAEADSPPKNRVAEKPGLPTLAEALDSARCDEIARLAALAASYWHSVELAADRGDTLTVRVHVHQVAAVTREAFSLTGQLGEAEAEP